MQKLMSCLNSEGLVTVTVCGQRSCLSLDQIGGGEKKKCTWRYMSFCSYFKC